MKNSKKASATIPKQKDGIKTDTDEGIKTYTEEEAKKIFTEAKEKLLDINHWDKLCGIASATFHLTDKSGNDIHRNPEKGDLIRIKLPAVPGSSTGNGYDWVRIETIEHNRDEEKDIEVFAIRVRPTENPESDKSSIAHFYTEKATNSFILERERNKIIAGIHGRNEVPNTKTSNVADKVRNAVVGISSISGLAVAQWKSLIHGLLGR